MIPLAKEKHPFLEYENYLTFTLVKRGRTDKTCVFCGNVIPIGTPHKVHLFNDYEPYPTHLECSIPFCATLR